MKKRFSLLFTAIIVTLLTLALSVSAWSADKVVLRYASEYMDKHPTVVNAIFPWIEEVKELSGGRLEIQFFNGIDDSHIQLG